MSELREVFIDDKYLITDKSSSDGLQIKYYLEGKWYKLDYYGGEAESEELASIVLSCTNIKEDQYVKYEKININGEIGCVSPEFRQNEDEEFITLYRLYKNIYGRDLVNVTSKMDYDDAIIYVIDFVKKQIGLDITTYLANTFWLDAVILNTDRHFNNYGIIMCNDGYREAPIFDNGKSLLTGFNLAGSTFSIYDSVKKVYSKSFSPNFNLNYSFLREYCTISLDIEKLKGIIDNRDETIQRKVLEYQLDKQKCYL